MPLKCVRGRCCVRTRSATFSAPTSRPLPPPNPCQPENILFTASWRLVLADFGVSINLLQERAVTRAGTEGYMAPEVVVCPLKSDPAENKDKPDLAYTTAVDIWAVGVLAYEVSSQARGGAGRRAARRAAPMA